MLRLLFFIKVLSLYCIYIFLLDMILHGRALGVWNIDIHSDFDVCLFVKPIFAVVQLSL